MDLDLGGTGSSSVTAASSSHSNAATVDMSLFSAAAAASASDHSSEALHSPQHQVPKRNHTILYLMMLLDWRRVYEADSRITRERQTDGRTDRQT